MSIILCLSFRKAFCALGFFLFCVSPLLAQTVRIDTTKPANAINPRDSVGAGVDRIQVEAIDHDLTKEALQPVLDSGWQPVTYRQNTDLAVEAWHWNPEGTWSDRSGKGENCARVARRGGERNIAEHGGDAKDLGVGVSASVEKRERIIDAGVDIEDEWAWLLSHA